MLFRDRALSLALLIAIRQRGRTSCTIEDCVSVVIKVCDFPLGHCRLLGHHAGGGQDFDIRLKAGEVFVPTSFRADFRLSGLELTREAPPARGKSPGRSRHTLLL